MAFDGVVLGRITMKYNGVLVAESTQRTTTAQVQTETERLMTLIELAANKTNL